MSRRLSVISAACTCEARVSMTRTPSSHITAPMLRSSERCRRTNTPVSTSLQRSDMRGRVEIVASCQLPVARRRVPGAGCRVPDAPLPVARCPLPVARSPTPDAHCALRIAVATTVGTPSWDSSGRTSERPLGRRGATESPGRGGGGTLRVARASGRRRRVPPRRARRRRCWAGGSRPPAPHRGLPAPPGRPCAAVHGPTPGMAEMRAYAAGSGIAAASSMRLARPAIRISVSARPRSMPQG